MSECDQSAEISYSSTIGSTTSRTTTPIQIIRRMSSRRRWTTDEKRAMVEATYDPGSSVAEVAECFEVSPAQLYSWRRQVAEGTLDRRKRGMPSFARVEVAEQAMPALLQPPAQLELMLEELEEQEEIVEASRSGAVTARSAPVRALPPHSRVKKPITSRTAAPVQSAAASHAGWAKISTSCSISCRPAAG
jgi:transposase-like protein